MGLACVAEVWGGNLKLDGTGVAAGLAAAVPLAATSVGMIGMIEPVLASAVAWITLGASECWTLRLCTDMPVQRRSVCELNAAQLAGGAVLLLGVALAETARLAVGQNGPHARGESDPAADTAAPQRDSSPAAA